jgi:hypothetical protein
MNERLTEADARRSLRDHLADKAFAARSRFRMLVDRAAIMTLLDDRAIVRYPVGVRFDSEPLMAGEFAALQPLGEHPSQGYCLFIHPSLECREDLLPLVIAYYIPSVNYGEIATPEDAEQFGATLLGIGVDEYYQSLCDLADSL